jgi:D-glycero-alpha-D-manno-heptose 1-phosphate guanylyltransferase
VGLTIKNKMKGLATVSVAILAGGLGTRLHSVVADRPKVLAEIGGKPFLAYLLDQLLDFNVSSVILCTGYMGKQVQAKFGDRYGRLRLLYSREMSPLGTAGALRLALPLFESESVLILNGDSFCEANLEAFWEWHCVRDADATILLTEKPDTRQYGRVYVDAEGRVLRFEEKDEKNVPGWINAGVYLIKRQLLLTIPEDGETSLERLIFPKWIGRQFYGYRTQGCFLDIGTPEGYALAEQFFDSSLPK